MPDDLRAPPRPPRASGIATALMCALAGGAVWCLLSLYSRMDLGAMAFVVALFVVWALRTHGYAGWFGAALAAFCVALAALYAFALQAIAQVAALFGLSMRAAIHNLDLTTTLELAWFSLRGWNLALVALAMAMAVGWMLRPARKAPR